MLEASKMSGEAFTLLWHSELRQMLGENTLADSNLTNLELTVLEQGWQQ